MALVATCLRLVQQNDHNELRDFLATEDVQLWVGSGGLDVTILGQRPLVYVAAKQAVKLEDTMECLRILLKAKVCPNIKSSPDHNSTPLHLAVSCRHEGCVRLLLEHKVGPVLRLF